MLSELTSSMQRALTLIGTVNLILTVAIVTILCIATFFLVRMSVEFFRFRGWHKLLCPETGDFARVRIGAVHAAISSLLDDPDLRVRNCSRWPERQGCGQECLRRVRYEPVFPSTLSACPSSTCVTIGERRSYAGDRAVAPVERNG